MGAFGRASRSNTMTAFEMRRDSIRRGDPEGVQDTRSERADDCLRLRLSRLHSFRSKASRSLRPGARLLQSDLIAPVVE